MSFKRPPFFFVIQTTVGRKNLGNTKVDDTEILRYDLDDKNEPSL